MHCISLKLSSISLVKERGYTTKNVEKYQSKRGEGSK
jgi:hypothetical protein